MTLRGKKISFLIAVLIIVPMLIAGLQFLLGSVRSEKTYQELAEAAANRGDWPGVQSVAQEWQKVYTKSAMAYVALGDSYYRQGQFATAISAYDMALKLDMNMAEVWARFGASLFNTGKYAEAITACGNSLKLNPAYNEALLCQGLAYAFSGDAGSASASYGRLSSMAPAMAANMKAVVKQHACPQQGAKLGKAWCE